MANTSKNKTPKKATKKGSKSNEKVLKSKESEKTKVEDTKKINIVFKAIKKFLNNPLPMLVVLTFIIIILLVFIISRKGESKIYVGEIINDDVIVTNIHYFANEEMNYFYATNAQYTGDDAKIYGYQIGYFVVDEDGEYHEFVTRSGKFEKATSLIEVVREQSGWNVGELAIKKYFFDREVLDNLDRVHFMILASTDKDNLNKPDIKIDQEIKFTKLNKEK